MDYYSVPKIWFKVAFFLLFVSIFISCGKGKKKEFEPVSSFSEYVNGYSGGVISAHKPIMIEFTADIPEEKRNMQFKNLFDFNPKIKGSYKWITANTIAFYPEKPLPQNTKYEVNFEIGKILNLEENLQIFHFDFTTIKQQMEVQIEGLKPQDIQNPINQVLEFSVHTADLSDSASVTKALNIMIYGQDLNLKYISGSSNTHKYEVHNIVRQDESFELDIIWDAKKIGGEGEDRESVRIPSKSEFVVTSAKVLEGADTYIEVRFSDPISSTQDLEGMVYIEDYDSRISFISEAYLLKIYLQEIPNNNIKLIVNKGVKSSLGYNLNEEFTTLLEFGNTIPSVNIVGQGNIIPGKSTAYLPLEVTGLKAVDIKIMKIPEQNVFQFLQVNPLYGDDELIRVARTISQKTYVLPYTNLSDLNQRKTYTLDLNKIIETEPGALYRIEVSFRKEYATLDCIQSNEGKLKSIEQNLSIRNPDEPAFYGGYNLSYYGDYYYDDEYWENYDWRERDNPCHTSFYNSEKTVSRNILATSVGILARRGIGNKMLVATTDINTAQPLSGANIEVYNYQKQLIGRGVTDNSGLSDVDLKPNEFAFMIVATKGVEKAYLRVDKGTSLPNSMFDISGEIVQEGLKGFIYTERGVWRPGDSIYVGFILQDMGANLPKGVPVILELYDPFENLVDRQMQTSNVNHILTYITQTTTSALTGNYQLKLKVGGAEFSKTLKIENIKPNRLKIFIEHQDKFLSVDKNNSIKIRSEWLTGLKASGLRAVVEMKFRKTQTQFPQFSSYIFDDLSKTFYNEEEILFDGKLDNEGGATMSVKYASNDAPGMLNLQLTTRIFEDGGAFSIDAYNVPYHPYKHYVGVKVPKINKSGFEILETNQNHKFEIVSVDYTGKPVAQKKLRVALYKLEYKWWWEQFEYGLSYYTENNSRYEVFNDYVSTGTDGKASINLAVASRDWGRYFVKVCDEDGGHCAGTTVYFDWPDWYSRGDETSRKQAAILNVNSDKDEYNVGENIKLSFLGAEGSRALVTMENGTSVIDKKWVNLKNGENVLSFKASNTMAPNIYFNVAVIQAHQNKSNDLPLRLYGIKKVEIKDPKTVLTPVIDVSERLIPGKEARIKVREKDGKPMNYTLAIVDDGLLDLTRFKTPDPHRYFFSTEALGVYSWDLYDLIIGNHTVQAGRIITLGGDAEIDKKAAAKARRFKPMIKFFGPIQLVRGSTKEHKFIVPEYYGSVRLMVVAASDKSYGSTEKSAKVSKPVMVYATAPRVLSIQEKFILPVSVFAMEAGQKSATITIKTKGLKVNGNKTQTVNLVEGGEVNTFFELETNQRSGTAQIVVEAKAGNHQANYVIDVEVRNPNPVQTKYQTKIIKPGELADFTGTSFGVEGSNSATLEISGFPGIRVFDRLEYLLQYPYGCLEQITSAAFAQLYIPLIIELKEADKTKIKENIKSTLQTISTYQNSEGGIPYWRNTSTYNEWTEVFVYHFALAAKDNGYYNAEQLLSKSKTYQINKARRFSVTNNKNFSSDMLTQAYRLYTLAYAGSPETGAMNRLKENKYIPSTAIYLLSAAYAMNGQDKASQDLIAKVGKIPSDKKYPHNLTFGSELRDQAIALIAYSQLKNKENAEKLAQKLADKLNKQGVYSTQTTAFALFALSSFMSENQADVKMIEISVNDKVTEKIQFQNHGFSKTLKSEGENNLVVKNTGSADVVVNIIKKGIPAPGNEAAKTSTLKVVRTFTDQNGKSIKPDAIKQGSDFRMSVTVTNSGANGNLENIALNQLIPSGWEILNERLFFGQDYGVETDFTYQDIRDDRVYTFFNLKVGESKTFTFRLNAAYLGEYYLPATLVEAMYEPEVSTLLKGMNVKVVK